MIVKHQEIAVDQKDPFLHCYDQIRRFEFDLQTAVNRLHEFLPKEVDHMSRANFQSVEAIFIMLYFYSYRDRNYDARLLVRENNSSEDSSTTQSAFKFDGATTRLSQSIKQRRVDFDCVKITYLLDKIDLIANFSA